MKKYSTGKTKIFLEIMKLSLLVFAVIISINTSLLASNLNAQSISKVKVTINFKTATIDQYLQELQKGSGLNFAYNPTKIDGDRVVFLNVNNETVESVLDRIFKNARVAFRQEGKMVYLTSKVDPVKISGRVTDSSTHEILVGVNVSSENGKITQTDLNGHFILDLLPGRHQLFFKYLGFELVTKDVLVVENQTKDIQISMSASTSTLDEVVVSYGKQKASEITGSISTVSAATLQDMPVGQFSQQLQGKVAGVQIAQSSGQPGRGMEFSIRGAASLFASSQPLFVIDGIPVTGNINNINPSEIESFSILKDASASSLYGSRAANGVILITTKHAKVGESKIEFTSNYGVQVIPEKRIPQPMNATEFAQFMKERWEDKVKYEGLDPAKTPLDKEYQDPASNGTGTNWFDLLTRKAPVQSYDLTVQSARENSSSTIIAGYQEQEGVVINTSTKLFSIRFNQDMSLLNDKFKIGFHLAPSYRIDHNNRINTDGANALWGDMLTASPLFSPVNPDGSMPKFVSSPGMVNIINPYAQITATKDDYKTTRILGNIYLNYELLKGLTLKTNLAVDKEGEMRNQFIPSYITTASMATGISSSVDNYSWTGETNLQYNKTYNEHNFEVLVGYSAQKFTSLSNSVSGTGFPSDDIPYINAATVISSGNGGTTQYGLLSSIARLNYNYKGKYLLSAAVRRDGSSKFGTDRRYGNFPSVSAGWIVSDENFMKNVKKINFLKIRGSYGITGNNSFDNFVSIANLGSFNYILNGQVVPGTTISTLGNTELAWERNKQLDIGLDISVLNNRVSLTYDYYRKISDGLIQDRPIPRASGFSTIKYNVGVFEFWGHELTLNTVNLTGRLKWNSNFNISFDRNLIKSLVDPGFIRRNNTVTSDYFRQQVGHHLGEFYGFVFDGLYKDAADLASSAKYKSSDIGTIKMRDLDGDGVIDDINDRTFIGDPTPDFSFGFTNNFVYKKFDLNITMSGSVGGQVMSAMKWKNSTDLDGSRVPLKAIGDRWRSIENPGSGVYPRTKAGTTALGRSVNSQMVEDGSFLTAKNISMGYTVDLKRGGPLKNIRVYGSVQQAFIITGYSGENPEINNTGLDATNGIGIDENAYPVPRTFSIGFSAMFK